MASGKPSPLRIAMMRSKRFGVFLVAAGVVGVCGVVGGVNMWVGPVRVAF